ncbi:hypothetical protein [Lactiplantibacillus plantarum]|uniref:hypothetical protein n=1 Tax=Lactiplantibacillus plantarum TaxID=1590 RepID=UPI0040463D72
MAGTGAAQGETWSIAWPPLKPATAKEEADVRKANAEASAREMDALSAAVDNGLSQDQALRYMKQEGLYGLVPDNLGQVDQVIYSLAAPRRTHPVSGAVFNSTLKPVGQAVTLRGLDTDKEVIKESVLEPATQEEIDATVAVMGGEDWQMWIDALLEAGP